MKSSADKKKSRTAIEFTSELVAPCGMNCGSCLGYMRTKKQCPGCRNFDISKPEYCRQCIIIKCEHLRATESKFCYDCPKYPCTRMKNLNKRYSTRYNTSFFNNLSMIKEKGMEIFLAFETKRRTCPQCGSIISVHRTECFDCGFSQATHAT